MKRFVSISLVFSLIVSMFVVSPSAANTPVDVRYNIDAANAWDIQFENWFTQLDPTGILPTVFVADCWREMNEAVFTSTPGRVDSYQAMLAAASSFNYRMNNLWSDGWFLMLAATGNTVYAVVKYDSNLGAYVLVDEDTGMHIVAQDGRYIYYEPVTTDSSGGSSTDANLGGQWKVFSTVDWTRVHLMSEYALYDMGYALRDAGTPNDTSNYQNSTGSLNFQYLRATGEQYMNQQDYVYCDPDGWPYVARLNPGDHAVDTEQKYYPEDDDGDGKHDDGEAEDGQIIDIDAGVVVMPDGTLNYIDNLIYDESTKTYYVDAHEEYNTTNNTFVSMNYHIEYHINYTSVTYIGQTEEYDERYEFYYELPDGRSSADLTAEELQVLNTQIDVLPYIRSADATSIRALYHFDGDCLDSSYWSHLGSLTWNKGASITYMDVGAFNGALYLDENAHDFTVTLPSILGTKDFTIQWRYYQSQTLAPSTDSSFSIGDTTLLQFNGSSILNADGDVLSPVSVGNWQEIALVRKDGIITVFLNGVAIGSIVNGNSMDKTLHFVFGSDQQTYKYFDELRVVNQALYDTAYTPTSVPFDTNLALVLPDSQLPVADEYWNIKSSGTNLLSEYGLDWWTEMVTEGNEYFKEFTCTPSVASTSYSSSGRWSTNGLYTNSVSSVRFPVIKYLSTVTDISIDGGLSLTSKTFTDTLDNDEVTLPLFDVLAGSYQNYYRPIYGLYWNVSHNSSCYLGEGTYTFSIVTENGEVTSLTFTLSAKADPASDVYVEANGYRLALYHSNQLTGASVYDSDLAIQPLEYDKPTPRIVYMELVEGDSTDLSAEFVSSVVVMDKDDLNTPSLAVRTDIGITGYQLGGVRPSLPEKGLVWALIESGRITSLQIYNGQAWEAVDGRIWTGSRWVPYYAYDVLLLKDLWDIVESDPTLDPIYTETGFWTWLQNAWGDMLGKLDLIILGLVGSGGSGGSGSGSQDTRGFWDKIADAFTDGLSALIRTAFDMISTILKTLLSLVTDMLSFVFGFITETVLGAIGDFFSIFTDGSLLDGFQQTDENGNTTTQLPEGVSGVFADFSAMTSALPAELVSVLVVGIGLLFFLAVIKLVV